jgi:hypothetical protein
MNRSLSLIDAFTLLVEHKNALAAVPLIRLQIDNIIRLYACWLVREPPVVAEALLTDQPLRKLKSRSGKPLTDKFLYDAAAEHYPWIPEVYKQTSGFVHLSGRHIFAPVVAADDATHTISLAIGGSREWTEKEILESVNAFIEATKCLLHLCGSWLLTKEMGQMPPAERAERMGVSLPNEFEQK